MKKDDLHGLIAGRPRTCLGRFPTPLQSFSQLIVKRDDLTDLAMGGSKVRMLEFFVGEALARSAQILVTAGPLQSNHCRLTAAAAARCGLECHLLIIGQPENKHRLEGNKLLSVLLGAQLFHIDRASAKEQIDEHLTNLRKNHVPFYFISDAGHSPTGLWGYLSASLELITQLEELCVSPGRLYVACGRGTAQAGLLLGLRLLGCSLSVIGVSVARSSVRCQNEIHTVIGEFCEQHKLDNPVSETDIEIDDRWIGAGYDAVPPERWQIIAEEARRNALLLDPIYTGRTMQAVLDYVSRGGREKVIFVHTGGLPGLFVADFQKEMTAALNKLENQFNSI
ncbi:MAG TPA: pyridoxal-phosphate dependent enzyme [Sedimentisphaerales bacterium]|nr:pyridoxal-phosphate dependent enzyme [Sedimentisphaerales bacterium]